MRFHVYALLIMLTVSGCVGAGRQAGGEGGLTPEERARQEKFDPALLPGVLNIPPHDFTAKSGAGSGEVKEYHVDTSAGEAETDSSASVPGYRIQVFTSTSFVRAEEAHLNAIASIGGQAVYMIFDQPYYKIRVGDFIRREDAEYFRTQNLQRLYPDAWVVQTTIFPYGNKRRMMLEDTLLYADSLGVQDDSTRGNPDRR